MATYQNFKDGKLDGAIPLKAVMKMSDQDVTDLLQLGSFYYRQGQVDKALTILEGLAAVDPDNAMVQGSLGAIYVKAGRNEEALATLNRAHAMTPNDISVLVNRGEVMMRLGRTQEAGRDFKQAMDLDPQRKDPAANRARLIVVGLAAVARKIEEVKKPK